MRETLWLRLRRSALLRRLYNFASLSGPIRAVSFLLVPSTRRVRMKVQSGPGKDLILDVNPRWEHPFLEGEYEAEVQNWIKRICRPGVTFFDVGANFGYYSMLATRYGANAIAFEPDLANVQTLQLHMKLNGFGDRIKLERVAVFSHTGQLFLSPAGGEHPHGNAHVRSADSTQVGMMSVSCTTLDDFVVSNPAPGIVKIDVEGAESEVLKGALQIFQSVRPFLICEIHDEENEKFICSWLEDRKYAMRWSEAAQLFPRQLFAWPAEQDESTIATKPESGDQNDSDSN